LAGNLQNVRQLFRKITNAAPTTLSEASAASQSTFIIVNLTPLAIGNDDKNKPIRISTQEYFIRVIF
jgi:hypothetical protein